MMPGLEDVSSEGLGRVTGAMGVVGIITGEPEVMGPWMKDRRWAAAT
jgi:hypothetical protein